MYEEITESSFAKKKKRSRGTRGGGSRRRKDRNEPKYQQQNGQQFLPHQQNVRINTHYASIRYPSSYDQYPPALVMSSSSLSVESSSSGSFSIETPNENINPADAFNSLMEFPCLPPVSNRNGNTLVTQEKKHQHSTMEILPSKDMMLNYQERKSLQLDNPIEDTLAHCSISLDSTSQQKTQLQTLQRMQTQVHHRPEEIKEDSHFKFTNVMERINKQRQMLPRGGSLFEISPRSFLLGNKKN